MPSATGPKHHEEPTHVFRSRMRAQGYRPAILWLPDVTSDAFKAEARRESQLIAQSPGEADDQAFVDAVSDRDW